MQSTLRAIQSHPSLRLQLVVTGMHLDRTRGRSIDAIRSSGWNIDHVVRWRHGSTQSETAIAAGRATTELARAFAELHSEIVLVVGDRVEAFAAAAAGHISGRIVAHVHGGDRALGLVDDALRHSITKLAHVHFPATARSARRIARLGEDRWRIHRAGSPGLDDVWGAEPWLAIVARFPALRRGKYALLALHPDSAESGAQRLAAEVLLAAVKSAGLEQAVVIYPNNDPGADGIVACWKQAARAGNAGWIFCPNLPRRTYLGLLRDAAMLAGNSSSGIIEAASFGTPVIDVGPRQMGRERGANVKNVACELAALTRALKKTWNNAKPRRFPMRNLYGTGMAGKAIAAQLAHIDPARYVRKLIIY
jgi:GDP/UDP-N,N'-diacetylbacillosamine 2-epimerase (hydrolysing)